MAMRGTVLITVWLLSLTSAGQLNAQGLDTPTRLPGSPEHDTCNMCHGAHTDGSAPYTLRTGEPLGWTYSASSGTGPGPLSQSCLRCHSTPDGRARQRDVAASAPVLAPQARYLGSDLGDDHPLGRISSDWGRPGGASNSGAPDRWNAELFDRNGPLGGPVAESLECTTCHDPHDRAGGTAEPERERALCGGCHDPLRYDLSGHTSAACSDCHRLHSGHQPSLLAEPSADVLCLSCHDPGGSRTRAAAPRGHIEPQSKSCISCHSVHHFD